MKASANTATFEQLFLAYSHVMTDSQTPPSYGVAAQWLPPMRPSAAGSAEPQMSMFRSSIRDNRSWPVAAGSSARTQLTPMQMMELRAAIAAVNTVQLRFQPDVRTAAPTRYVASRHLVLADSAGRPAYDVELFGTARPAVHQRYVRSGEWPPRQPTSSRSNSSIPTRCRST